jgi:hypothetical protein
MGSFSREEVLEGLRAGRFLPTDMAWEEGMPDWRPLSQVMADKSAAAMPAPGPAGVNALPISSSTTSKPRAFFWYKVYCGLLAAVYFLSIIAGVVMLTLEDSEKLIAAILIVFGVPFLFASLLPLFFQPKPWLWIYGIVLIAVGFTSCCFWPICIPLFIFWLKPDIQRFFGRNA